MDLAVLRVDSTVGHGALAAANSRQTVVERGATAVALRANVVPRSPATCRVLTACPAAIALVIRRRAWFASFRCGGDCAGLLIRGGQSRGRFGGTGCCGRDRGFRGQRTCRLCDLFWFRNRVIHRTTANEEHEGHDEGADAFHGILLVWGMSHATCLGLLPGRCVQPKQKQWLCQCRSSSESICEPNACAGMSGGVPGGVPGGVSIGVDWRCENPPW